MRLRTGGAAGVEDGLGAAHRERVSFLGCDGNARDSVRVSAGLPVLAKAVTVRLWQTKVVTRSFALVLGTIVQG